MGIRDWLDLGHPLDGDAVATSRDVLNRFDKSVLFRQVTPQTYVWFLVYAALFLLTRALLLRTCASFRSMTTKRQVTSVSYIMQLVTLTACLIPAVIFGAPLLGVSELRWFGAQRMQDWGEHLEWTRFLDSVTCWVGFIVTPLFALYVGELFFLAAGGALSPEVTAHHVSCLTLMLYIVEGGMQCVDFVLFRFGFLLMLHAFLEQPLFLALLLHRFRLVRRLDIVWACTGIYVLVLRLSLTGALLWTYADICWSRDRYTSWTVFFRYFLPPGIGLLLLLQFQVLRVYWALYKRHVPLDSKYAKAQPDAATGDRSESTTEEAKRGSPDCSTALPVPFELHQVESTSSTSNAAAAGYRCHDTTPSTSPHCGSSTASAPLYRAAAAACCIALSIFALCWLGLQRPNDCRIVQIGAAGQPQPRVAVVGGGVSGMAAAWRLADAGYDVTMFESEPVLGGGAATAAYTDPVSGDVRHTDLALRVWRNYHNFEQLLGFLNVSHSSTSSLVSKIVHVHRDGNSSRTMWVGDTDHTSEARRLWRLVMEARETYSETRWMAETIGDMLDAHNFSESFTTELILPCMGSYVGTGAGLLNTSLATYWQFDSNFRICTDASFVSSVDRFSSSSREYVDAFELLLRRQGVRIRTSTMVDHVSSSSHRVTVVSGNNGGAEVAEQFDHVILTGRLTHMASVLRHSADPLTRELFGLTIPSGLGSVPVLRTVTVAFNGTLESEQTLWDNITGCWKGAYFSNHIPGLNNRTWTVAYDVTGVATRLSCRVQPPAIAVLLADAADLLIVPPSSNTFTRYWDHTAHTPNFWRVGRNLHKIQGKGGIWFAGGDVASALLHETALVSGLVVAQQLGATYPWPEHAQSASFFVALRDWMMFGVNYVAPLRMP